MQPIASRWQMPFASSRGYGSLTLQHDTAEMLNRRYARTKQRARVYFVSDLDASGLDLQRSWEDALDNFGVDYDIVRIGLTRDQVRDNVADSGMPLADLSIEVKASDSRSASYTARYDILLSAVIEAGGEDIHAIGLMLKEAPKG